MKVADLPYDDGISDYDDGDARKVKPMTKVPKKSKKELAQYGEAFNLVINRLPQFDEAIKGLRFASTILDAAATFADVNDYGGDGEDEIKARATAADFNVLNANITQIIRCLKVIGTECAYAELEA